MYMPDFYFFQNDINHLRVREREKKWGRKGGVVNTFNIICMPEEKKFLNSCYMYLFCDTTRLFSICGVHVRLRWFIVVNDIKHNYNATESYTSIERDATESYTSIERDATESYTSIERGEIFIFYLTH